METVGLLCLDPSKIIAMRKKTEILRRIETTILPHAMRHVPEGSTVAAVIDQWIQAIATGGGLYCRSDVVTQCVLRETLISDLQSRNLFNSQRQFYDDVFECVSFRPIASPKFQFVDLFAGIGGMRLAFQCVGGACIFSSESDAAAQNTYKQNYGEVPFGDIRKVPPENIPDHDVLLAGFPCQPFSHAGLKKGIEDTRGTLFYNIARILDVKQPKIALLENVRGLISHDSGRTLRIILQAMTSIGYSCNIPRKVIEYGSCAKLQEYAKGMVLRSADFGVPQNRKRVYIVLWKNGELGGFEYPKPSAQPTRVADILDACPDVSLTISDRLWEGHKRRKEENARNGRGFGYGIVTADSPYTNTLSARYYKDGSEILVAQEGRNPRKLSLREAARLQGFPEQFEPCQSKTQAYKQFGNSVTVPVLKALALSILDASSFSRGLGENG